MGISIAADIFQRQTSLLFLDLNYVLVYIDDLLVYTKGSFEDHLSKLSVVLNRLYEANFKVNIDKCHFATKQVDYLGYKLTPNGFQPQEAKVRAIMALRAPTSVKEVRRVLGFLNFYKDFIAQRSETLNPIVQLTRRNQPFHWGEAQANAFRKVKMELAKDVLLRYPDPNLPFDVYADASDNGIGLAILQNEKPIAFFSQTLTGAQKNYTTTQKETLAIVKGLQAYRNILLGRQIRIFTDHKNITYLNSNSPQIIRWKMAFAEFTPQLHYIEGHKNVIADFLSRYPIMEEVEEIEDFNPYESFAIAADELPLYNNCPVD